MNEHQKKIYTRVMIAVRFLTYFLIGVSIRAMIRHDLPSNPSVTCCVFCELVFSLLLISSSLSLLRGDRTKNSFSVFFLWMLLTTIAGLLSDILSWGIGFSDLPAFSFITQFGYTISRFAAFPLIILYSTYLISYINYDSEEMRGYAMFVAGLAGNGILLVNFSLFTARDAVQPWTLQDHPWVYFFFLCMPVGVNILTILAFRKRLSNRRAITFMFYELLVIGAVAFDTIIQDVTIAYIAVSYVLLQLYLSVQIEHEKEQEDAIIQQRIAAMLSQIQPHFLYNVLTGIRALCRTDAEKAEDALTNFTIYLRGNLNSIKSSDFVPFLQELDHIKHYVELEKMRYGDELKVEYNVSASNFFVPPLSVEPIVENAVSHGVMQKAEGGTVNISTRETGDEYVITIKDDGVGFDVAGLDSMKGDHVGLANARERIGIMCGGNVLVQSEPGAGTTVDILIPKAAMNKIHGGNA